MTTSVILAIVFVSVFTDVTEISLMMTWCVWLKATTFWKLVKICRN